MKEQGIIYFTSEILIATSCFVMLIAIAIHVRYRQHLIFLPVSIWLFAKLLSKITIILMLLKIVGVSTVVSVNSFNALSSILCSVMICFFLHEWINKPCHREMKITNDALAKVLGEITTEREK